ncbi:histidine kinase dimerization/phosphoacceptor domain -containing protein [Rhodoligotrophos ferricapiens]|uniref:histidine kinase dimerization/phosphoacceptor domain -containing protein n=1 Tax=Rhodoligotrophos ferricapiens TaxID=3069264 RepID=UPI00315CEE3C
MPGQITIPENEADRLAVVRRYDLLDSASEPALDRIAGLAARLTGTPMALVTIVDDSWIWFKGRHGLDLTHSRREPGLCASAIFGRGPHVIGDTQDNPIAATNALVAGAEGVRFYAGLPLITRDGHALGCLCVMDREPRGASEQELSLLEELAAMVMDQLELRRLAQSAVARVAEVMADKDRALERAELMKQETDHRIMNSLQLVSSLLLLQSRSVDNPQAAEHLRSAASRVSTVAQVHRHFYLDTSIQNVPSLTYLRNLCAGLSEMLRLNELAVEGDEIHIPAKQVVPIGLIVNEFVTNAAKYGGGRITVALKAAPDNGYVLSVTDQGPGLAEGFDPRRKSGLGMKVVRVLAQQLGGRLAAGPGPDGRGAQFSIKVSPPAS